MLAVFVDAMLDMMSGFTIMITYYMKRLKDRIRYPVGRRRLEPLGVIGMACLMTAATLVTLEQAVGSLLQPIPSTAATAATSAAAGTADQSGGHHLVITWDTCAVLLTALTIKAGLFIYCRAVPDNSVKALAEDHFNDCLSNVVTLATIFLARFFAWWIDPIGAIIISFLIIRNWIILTLHHCDQLLGKVASTDILNLVTFVACSHSELITKVDTVTAYHVGTGIYSEVHVVLDKDMPLSVAHDIGEALQNRIERLPQIERCFVHLDVESAHSPMTEHKDI